MKQGTVVFVGHLAINTDITADGISYKTFGGSGYYTGATASIVKAEHQTIGVSGRIGNDDFGKHIIFSLRDLGIDISGIEIDEKKSTARFQLTETGNSSDHRLFKGSLGAGIDIVTLFPLHYTQASYIHIATAPPQQQLEWINTFSPQISPDSKISVDAFEAYAKKFPKETYDALTLSTSYVFLNEEEWDVLEKWGHTSGGFTKLIFPVPTILKRGARGATIIYPDRSQIDVPAEQVTYINGTGAGETLAAVFLTRKAQGIDDKKALEEAVRIASLSVTDFGVDHVVKKRNK